jgi:replicative DNA helicase
LLDAECKGGLGKKEFGVVVGGTGSGKSMVLSYMAAMAMAAGYNVFYYTLELADIVIGRRIDACLTGIPQEGLMVRKEEVFERISQFPGKILIKEFPGGHRTLLSKIINHTKKEMKSGNVPDVIFLDYADLLKTTANFSEKRINLEELFDELRGTAQELGVAFWTVSQTNRGGYQTEQVDLNDISESFGKVFCADLVVTLARTLEQKELDLATFQIAKNRNGRDGLIYDGILDTSKVYVEFKKKKVLENSEDVVRKSIRESFQRRN